MKSGIDSGQFIDFGGDGPLIHFSHGNGFHPQSYRKLLNLLQIEYRLLASAHRSFWNAGERIEDVSSLHVFADDLISTLDSKVNERVYGVGHSLGAIVTLLAANKRPDLFKSLILIDPVFIPPSLVMLFNTLPWFIQKRVSTIKKALNRPDTWSSRDEAFEYHRKKRVFKRIDDDVLWDYINPGTIQNEENRVTLKCSKRWEVHCYTLVPNAWPSIAKCKVPVFGIRAENSDVLLPSAWQRWKTLAPSHQLIDVPNSGHLLPFELPKVVGDLIKKSIIA